MPSRPRRHSLAQRLPLPVVWRRGRLGAAGARGLGLPDLSPRRLPHRRVGAPPEQGPTGNLVPRRLPGGHDAGPQLDHARASGGPLAPGDGVAPARQAAAGDGRRPRRSACRHGRGRRDVVRRSAGRRPRPAAGRAEGAARPRARRGEGGRTGTDVPAPGQRQGHAHSPDHRAGRAGRDDPHRRLEGLQRPRGRGLRS